MSTQRYSVTPHPIETLLTWVKSREIAIPEIQRPFVWEATKVRNLLDSLYLSNALYTGNSAKAWYLLADPSDLPVIEMAFLNGQEAPTVETSDADFNMLGIRMRGYHDFGVNLQDPRGGVKSKGEV